MNEIEKLMDKMNYYKNSGIKDPFKELSFFISSALKYLGMNLWKYESKTKALFSILVIINWLHRNATRCTHRDGIYVYRDRDNSLKGSFIPKFL